MALLADGNAVSASLDGTLRVWDLAAGECVRVMQHGRAITCAAVLPNDRVVCGYDCSQLSTWCVATGQREFLTHGVATETTKIALVSDTHMVSCSGDGSMQIWGLSPEGAFAAAFTTKQAGYGNLGITCVARIADGRFVAGSWAGYLSVWDLNARSATPRGRFMTLAWKGHAGSVNFVAAMPDGHLISGDDERACRWE